MGRSAALGCQILLVPSRSTAWSHSLTQGGIQNSGGCYKQVVLKVFLPPSINQSQLLSRDGYLLEPTVCPKGSQASWGVWIEDSAFLSRPCRKRRPSSRGPTHVARLEFPRETGLILRCAGKAGNPFQTTMQEKKALSSRGRGRLRGFLELRRPWGLESQDALPLATRMET